MGYYNASLDTARFPEEMFAYLSDFSTTVEWDPGVVETPLPALRADLDRGDNRGFECRRSRHLPPAGSDPWLQD
jgi:hypothetical protein